MVQSKSFHILFPNKKTLWPLFMDVYGWVSTVSRQQCHYEETVYSVLLSPQEFLVLIWSTSEGWKAESMMEPIFTLWIMAILPKGCKPDNFELHNSLSFANIWDLCVFVTPPFNKGRGEKALQKIVSPGGVPKILLERGDNPEKGGLM